jgi:hypothetical protein
MKTIRILFSLLAVLGTFALAHQPYWNETSPTLEQAFTVENVTVSKALFGNLETDEVDYFKLEIPDGLTVDLSLFVGGGCSDTFNPQLYLVGPNLPANVVPFAVPPAYGSTLAQGDWKPYSGHGLKGRKGPSIRETLGAGTHYLVVHNHDESGFYLISLSGSEVFGAGPGGLEAIPRFNDCK